MKKVIRIVAVSVTLTILLTAVKFKLTPFLMKDAQYGLAGAKRLESIDNLFIGSSMFRKGIDLEPFTTDESTAYNLCANGNQPWSEYLELQQLVDDGIEIRHLFVDMYSGTASSEISFSDIRLIQGAELPFVLTLFDELRDNGNGTFADLYEMIVTSNNELFYTWPISYPLRNVRYANGGATGVSQGSTKDILDRLETGIPQGTSLNEVQCTRLKELCGFCKEHGIEVCFVETPKYEKMFGGTSSYPILMELYARLLADWDCKIVMAEKTVHSFRNDVPENVVTYSFDHSNPEFFSDLIHMSTAGQKAFSQTLFQITEDHKV